MAESITAPSIRQPDVDRVRDNLLVSLRQQRDDKNDTATKVMWRELFGAAHPFGHTPLGTEEGLGKITSEDLREFHNRAFTPAGSVLVITGNLSRSRGAPAGRGIVRRLGRRRGTAGDAAGPRTG